MDAFASGFFDPVVWLLHTVEMPVHRYVGIDKPNSLSLFKTKKKEEPE